MKFVNHIEPVAPRRAGGAVAEVYAEARREFGRLPEPLAMLSPVDWCSPARCARSIGLAAPPAGSSRERCPTIWHGQHRPSP